MRTAKLIVLSAAFFALAAGAANAQSPIYLGVKGGISIPNLSAGGANPVSSGYSSIEGPYFGAFAEFGLTHHFSIQAELNYVAQGGQKNGQQAIPSADFAADFPPGYQAPEYFYANFKSKARFNYLELPILAKFTFSLGGPWKFLVDAGPYVGYMLNGKNITSDSSNVYADQGESEELPIGKQSFYANSSITDDLHRFNFGIKGGVGLEYFVHHCGYIYLELGGEYGIINVQKGTVNGKNQTGAATAALGYAFNLRGHKRK